MCERCDELKRPIPIRVPADLTRAIRLVREAIALGVLVQVPLPSPFSRSFEELQPEGPWDDLLDLRFRCTSCGQEFQLGAETYHGSGGEWSVYPPWRRKPR